MEDIVTPYIFLTSGSKNFPICHESMGCSFGHDTYCNLHQSGEYTELRYEYISYIHVDHTMGIIRGFKKEIEISRKRHLSIYPREERLATSKVLLPGRER